MRFEPDVTWRRFGRTVCAGSPLKLFRLTEAGMAVASALEGGNAVEASVLTDRLLDAGAIHPTIDDTRQSYHTLADVTVVTPQLGGEVFRDGRVTIDDGSLPPLAGAALRLEPNRGPAAARNAACTIVSTDLIAFVDADITASAGDSAPDAADIRSWTAPLLGHFDDPRVALVAPRVRGEDGSPLDLGERPARIRSGTYVSYVPGAAVLVRRSALDEIGWFDEQLRYGEDVDLVWRLDEAGWRCRYDPSVEVWHQPRRTWGARLRQHFGYGTSAGPLSLRFPGALSPLHVNGWTATAWALALLGPGRVWRWVAAAALAGASSAALVRKLPDLPSPVAVSMALRGHLGAGTQIATAARRVWWPVVALGALVSRRCRLLAVLAVLVDVRSAPTDLAYGWGVWTSMRRMRTWAPIVPRLTAWPDRTAGGQGTRTAVTSTP